MTCGWSGCKETPYQEVANKFFDNWITLGILLETGCEDDMNKCKGKGSALCNIGKNIYENVEKNGLKLNQVLNFIINNTNNTQNLCMPGGVHFNSKYPKKAPQQNNGSTNIDSNIAYVFVLFEDEIKEYMKQYPVEGCKTLHWIDCRTRNEQKNNFNTSLTELSGAMKGWAKELINGRNDTEEGSNFLNKWKNNENIYLTLNDDSIQVKYEKLKEDIETYETKQKERRNKGGKKTIRKRSKSIRKRTNKKKKRKKKKKKRNATKKKRTKKRR